MLRRFVTYDGEIVAEEEWNLNPTAKCFYCDTHLITSQSSPCPVGFEQAHEFVTLIHQVA